MAKPIISRGVATAEEPLKLSELRSFYIGGEERRVESRQRGEVSYTSGAMYVRLMSPVNRRFGPSVVFIHGGAHTGATWETTPDGRPGWETLFLRGGFQTVVIDQPWRGRSAPDLTSLNHDISDAPPAGRVSTGGTFMLNMFRRGGDRFAACAAAYPAQLWPDFGLPAAHDAGLPGLSDPRALQPLLDLIDHLGPVILVTHSQGGHLGWQAAIARPDDVAAILAIEPGLLSPGLDDKAFPDIPVQLLWGDNLPQEALALSLRDVELGLQLGRTKSNISTDLLPAAGIQGNGHMLMMEDNNAELAARAMRWLGEVLTKPKQNDSA